jgi:CBS domain-containing protein
MKTRTTKSNRRPQLHADTAAELMTTDPVTISVDATLSEATAILVDRHISALPVVDSNGRAIGVLSRSDIVQHDRETVHQARQVPEYFTHADLNRAVGEDVPKGFQVEQVDRTRVSEVMTPTVFTVRLDTPAAEVIRQFVALEVHRLFVVDKDGVLTGVISTTDIVRNLNG